MRVYVKAPTLSMSLTRVQAMLERYAPTTVQFVNNILDADLVVVHAIGFHDVKEYIKDIVDHGQKYVIVQYCFRSTAGNALDWLPMWEDAQLVWSYYDLPAALAADSKGKKSADFHFYESPLGADGDVFKPSPRRRHYLIATSGYVAETEGVNECAAAAQRINRPMFHLGPEMNLKGVTCSLGVNDVTLARMYSECEFVAGLRRCEGFELPAAEGLLCGCRPIVFDAPHYRKWYADFAEFVPEGTFDVTTDALEAVFRAGARPVTPDERAHAVEFFNWQTIVTRFWERAL